MREDASLCVFSSHWLAQITGYNDIFLTFRLKIAVQTGRWYTSHYLCARERERERERRGVTAQKSDCVSAAV
jgi:hypothetical protein